MTNSITIRTPCAVKAVALALCISVPCNAQPIDAEPPSTAITSSALAQKEAFKKRTKRRQKLPALPKPPSRRLPSPSKQALREVEATLKLLTSHEATHREAGLERLLAAQSEYIPAVRYLLDASADRADRRAMKRLLLDIRRSTRRKIKAETPDNVETPDYLIMVLSAPQPKNAAWQQLVRVLGLSRICSSVGTVEAIRTLIRVYVRFDFLRVDTQLRLAELGDHAIGALIETTRHPAPKVAAWAKKRLEQRGLQTPGAMVQIGDSQALANVLRALGTLRDPELTRVLLSFARSQRPRVREAARQAVVLVGNLGLWPLRDGYENFVGSKPPREWSWDRLARELFFEFDQVRQAELTELYNAGLIAWETGDLETMAARFDDVLTRTPDFSLKDQILVGYRRFLQKTPGLDPERRAITLTRIARLAEDPQLKQWAKSRLQVHAAQGLLRQDVVDRILLETALRLDPSNEHARTLLSAAEATPLVERQVFVRYVWPSLLGGLSLVFGAIVWLRRRSGASAMGGQPKPNVR